MRELIRNNTVNHLDYVLHVHSTVFIMSFNKNWVVYMGLHGNTFAALIDLFLIFVPENVAPVFNVVVRCDVRKFDADVILYVRKWKIQCFHCDFG